MEREKETGTAFFQAPVPFLKNERPQEKECPRKKEYPQKTGHPQKQRKQKEKGEEPAPHFLPSQTRPWIQLRLEASRTFFGPGPCELLEWVEKPAPSRRPAPAWACPTVRAAA